MVFHLFCNFLVIILKPFLFSEICGVFYLVSRKNQFYNMKRCDRKMADASSFFRKAGSFFQTGINWSQRTEIAKLKKIHYIV